MTQKQKAKAYDKALEKARLSLRIAKYNEDEDRIWSLIDMFPELEESKDEKIRNYLITYFTNIDDCASSLKGKDIIDWIKKHSTEWSEEDNVHLTNAILAAEKEWGTESCTSKWLKSLKPQFHWRPNEEQMKALHAILGLESVVGEYVQRHLTQLYEQLKSL